MTSFLSYVKSIHVKCVLSSFRSAYHDKFFSYVKSTCLSLPLIFKYNWCCKSIEKHDLLHVIGRIGCLLTTDDRPVIESVTNCIKFIEMKHEIKSVICI